MADTIHNGVVVCSCTACLLKWTSHDVKYENVDAALKQQKRWNRSIENRMRTVEMRVFLLCTIASAVGSGTFAGIMALTKWILK